MQEAIPFEALYKSQYGALRNTSAQIIGDKDAAHDVVQEVFLKIWHGKPLSTILNLQGYVFKAVVNASVTYLEKRKGSVPLLAVHVVDGGMADSDLLTRELDHKIQRAFNKLPPKCRAVFALSRFDELPNKEIAEVLGLSVKTVENQMGIAIKKMRAELKP